MAGSPELLNIPGLPKDARERVVAAFDALSNWRDEIETVNERCLGKVLDQMSTTARAMGWPDQAIKGTREFLENASKVQTDMIDQIMEGWKKQLRSPAAPMAFPRSLVSQVPGLSGSAMPEFNPFTPWTFWMQAAEAWQRTWMPDVSQRRGRSH